MRNMDCESSFSNKPHAVCIPLPHQSHITVMMNLSKLLHHKGFQITFINTDFNHARLLKSQGPKSLTRMPDFRFESIPDGLPASDPDTSQDIGTLCKAIKNNLLAPFLHLIKTKINDQPNTPTCFLSDIFMTFTYEAAQRLGIPVIGLSTISATALLTLHQMRTLMERGIYPIKDTDAHTHKVLELVPGMNHLRLKDLLRFEDADLLNLCLTMVEASTEVSAVIINTVDNLEQDELEGLASLYHQVYTIGPIHLILKQIPKESFVNSIRSNLWIEESETLNWLDSKDPHSVVYVNFGSIAILTMKQITEVAQGLVECKHNFLWVIRPDLLKQSILPPGFKNQIKERGFIASWCPQENVLKHSSVGVFLTHGGWNSILESVSSGVPMICRPFLTDQPTNCRYICTVWKVGIELETNMGREDVIKAIREVMDTEGGERMRERMMALKKMAHEVVQPNGSSYMNLDKVLNQMILNIQ